MKKEILLVQVSETDGHKVFLATMCEKTKKIKKVGKLFHPTYKLSEVIFFCKGFLDNFPERLEIIFILDRSHKEPYGYKIGLEAAKRHLSLAGIECEIPSPQTYTSVSLG